MIIPSADITEHSHTLGDKAKNLKRLIDHGFAVPDFVAIPSDGVRLIDRDPHKLDELCNTLRQTFPHQLYAVRSAALIEDRGASSMAGQFHTETKVSPSGLAAAITAVIEQAKPLLGGNLDKFSLIIQRYIEADIAGVCFTRDPGGRREMVIEYQCGAGEHIVGGAITPEHVSLFWNDAELFSVCDATAFQKIEAIFGFPQDIEWCVQNGTLSLLQTRPITTISADQYHEITFLETCLTAESSGDFCYAKTEISEMAPRPTPFTFSLIQAIYAADGPVEKVYRKYHVDYAPKDFLKLIGNELFVDRNAELQTLLPSFGILNHNYRPRFRSFRHLPRTIRNIFFTATFKAPADLPDRLHGALASPDNAPDFTTSKQTFLDDYEVVFETNLIAAQSLKRLEGLLNREAITLLELLGADLRLFDEQPLEEFDQIIRDRLVGNTLEIADESAFSSPLWASTANRAVSAWWQTLPQWKQKLLQRPIANALRYQRYCESARVLMLKNLNRLRTALLADSIFEDRRLAYFHTVDEVCRREWNEQLCLMRKQEYESFGAFELPAQLTRHFVPDTEKPRGLSAGKATGIIVPEAKLGDGGEPKILFTKILSPQLTRHFSTIVGIVTEKGGMLSHLAIMARERKIPIVVIGDRNDFAFGDLLEIDGGTGTVKKISSSPP